MDITRIDDAEREREVTEQVDTQLIFVSHPRSIKTVFENYYDHTQAGLFAAFLSAFLIETLSRLEEDPTATLLDVMVHQTQMMRNETLLPYHRKPFSPSRQIVAVNVLLFASLALIIVVAFISMLVKEWIREFGRGLAAIVKPRRRALVREYRYLGLERWKFLEIVHFLPALIYLSLLLFFCGLILLLLDIEAACGFVIAIIFALGILFAVTTTAIATIDDSAPFRSPLSRALGRHFRRLHSALLDGTTLWRRWLVHAENLRYSGLIGFLFDRLARMARSGPFSETYFVDIDCDPAWDEQDIHFSGAAINRLYMSIPNQGVSREVFRSIIFAGHPAHALGSWHVWELLSRWAPTSDDMTPESARAIGVLICRASCTTCLPLVKEYVYQVLPVLAGSNEPWDRLLTYLIESYFSEDHDGARSLQLAYLELVSRAITTDVSIRDLLIVRFLGCTVSCDVKPERRAAAVRVLSALLSRLHLKYFPLKYDQFVNSILQAFITINDIKLPDISLQSLSKFPSLPYLVYNQGVLSRVIDPIQWYQQTIPLLRAYQEFARALIECLWCRPVDIQLDSEILHGLPLSRLEDYAVNPFPGSYRNLFFASLLLEALISDSGRLRSDFPVLDKEDLTLDGVLSLYDSYLIQCNAVPSLPIYNLLSRENFHPLNLDAIEVHHPWLALHVYSLIGSKLPHQIIATLKWSDAAVFHKIACDRLRLYDSYDVSPEPLLISLFLSSSTYETILGAFKWHIRINADTDGFEGPLQEVDLKKIIAILFGPNLDENEIVSSWSLILDEIMPAWSDLPNEFKHDFVSEFFAPEVNRQSTAIKQNICLGNAWLEQLWSTVLASIANAVFIEKPDPGLNKGPFRWNRSLFGPMKVEPGEPECEAFLESMKIWGASEEIRLERARRGRLVRSVDEVLSTLAILLETARAAGVLSSEAVAHLQGSPLLSDPRLRQNASSLQRIEAIFEYYRPYLCPLPEFTPQEAEMLAGPYANPTANGQSPIVLPQVACSSSCAWYP
jgi:hypothetical protein